MYKLFIICIFISSCSETRDQSKNQSVEAEESFIMRDIKYGNDSLHTLDMYIPPKSKNNHILIIYIHGGGWYAGNKREAIHWADYFQNKGYAVASIDYRLTKMPEKNFHPTQMSDIDKALRFLVSKSDNYNFDSTKIIIMGFSAGAHLALMYGYKYDSSKRIKAAISLCGILDLTDQQLLNADLGDMSGSKMVSLFIGDTTMNIPKRQAASPVFNLDEHSPPTCFVHGKSDDIVPFQQSVKATNVLKKYNISTAIDLLENTNHNLLSIDLSANFYKVDSFIKAIINK
jgi:acetyl esterase/lipase